MINSPESRKSLDALREDLAHAVSAYQAARAALDVLQENSRTLRSGAAAAHADADCHRDDMRELLRKGLGKLDKQLHLKAAELRAALALHEEYSALAAELEAPIARAELEVSETAAKVIDLRRRLLRAFADAVVREAIAEIAPRLHLGMSIQKRLEAGEYFNDRMKVHFGNEDELVLADLRRTVTSALQSPDLAVVDLPEELRAALDQADLGSFVPMSPIARMQARQKLETVIPQESAA